MQDIILTPKTSSQKAENVQAFKVVCKVCGYYDLFSAEPKEWACKVCEARKQKKNPDGTIRLSSVTKLSTCPKGHKQLVRHWSEPCEKCVLIQAFEEKKKIILQFLDAIKPENVWDLGGNVGIFSRLASDRGIQTISFDIDPAAVEKNYLELKKNDEKHILPLILDLTNPSPGIGWENTERKSLIDRGPTDTAFALALIHHLAISNNLPFDKIANFFKMICANLVIEFVPKSDSQVQRLLSTREDIFNEYTEEQFKRIFSKYFTIRDEVKLGDSERKLFRMEKLSGH